MELLNTVSEYRKTLANIDLEQVLCYLSKGSAKIWNAEDEEKPSFHTEKRGGLYIPSHSYTLASLAYIASKAVVYAKGTEPFNLTLFNQAIEASNTQISIKDPSQANQFFGSTKNFRFRNIQVLLATAYPQVAISSQRNLINRFGRYWLLYTQIYNSLGENAARISSYFPVLNAGLTPAEFILAGVVTFVLAITQDHFDLASLSDVKFGTINLNKDKIERFLSVVATDPDTFSLELQRVTGRLDQLNKNLLPQYSLVNPITKYPIIKLGKSYYAPVPQLILERCGSGVYEEFKETLRQTNQREAENLGQYLGRAFERYWQFLIKKSSNSTWKIWHETEYTYENASLKTCDIIVLDQDKLLLIELKIKPMRPLTKALMLEDRYKKDLKEPASGIETIVRTAKHLKSGALHLEGLEINHVKRWAGIVITLDEYGLKPIIASVYSSDGRGFARLDTTPIRDYFMEICRKEIEKSLFITWKNVQNFPIENLQIVSTDNLEAHLAAVMQKKATLLDIINKIFLGGVHPTLAEQLEQSWGSIKS